MTLSIVQGIKSRRGFGTVRAGRQLLTQGGGVLRPYYDEKGQAVVDVPSTRVLLPNGRIGVMQLCPPGGCIGKNFATGLKTQGLPFAGAIVSGAATGGAAGAAYAFAGTTPLGGRSRAVGPDDPPSDDLSTLRDGQPAPPGSGPPTGLLIAGALLLAVVLMVR